MRNLFFVVASLLFISMAQGQNVGIGTTTPPAKLTVIGSPSNPYIPNTTSTGLFRIGVSPNEGIDFGKMGTAPFAGWIQSGIIGTTAHPLSLQPIDGNVGIGTTTPSEKLEVNGAIKSTIPYYGLTQSYGGVTIGTYVDNIGGWIGTASNHPLLFFTNNSNELMALTTTGYLGIGTTSPSNMLSVAGSADFSGNVGIGTTTPGAKLEVAGLLKITGGTPGAGKVLTSDATGLASWATPSATGSHFIGESYGGGIVFYVYDNGQHGLIAAAADQSTGIQWYNGTYRSTGATGDGLNAGAMNTALIVATQMADNQSGNFAAKVCADYSVTVGGITYGDWYLPSKYELYLLYLQRAAVGGFANGFYWSSSEIDNNYVWTHSFNFGLQSSATKNITDRVRAVRAF